MTVDVVAIGAHPDDVELGCAGTLLRLAAAGRSFAIVHLTRGERGSRGTPPLRVVEAEEAGRILGASEVLFLDCGDGGLRVDSRSEDQVIGALRRLRPKLVLGPPPADRHPDHERAHRLVRDACFYSGLGKRGAGAPHRPSTVLSYLLHDSTVPTLVVDVAATWSRKVEALAAHRSQFAVPSRDAEPWAVRNEPSAARDQPATRVSSRAFWDAIEGRARHYGQLVGCELGEAFYAATPLQVDDLMTVALG